MDKVLMRWRGGTVTAARALQVGGTLALLLLGVVLPYLTMEHFDQSFAVIRETASLTDAGGLTGLDATYLPSYDPAVRPDFNVAFNVLGLGPTLQIFGSLVATVTCWAVLRRDQQVLLLAAAPVELPVDRRAGPTVRRVEHGARPAGHSRPRSGMDLRRAGRDPDPRGDATGPQADRQLRRRVRDSVPHRRVRAERIRGAR